MFFPGLSNDEFYQKKKDEKILGYFIGPKPFLMVKDPDYVQRVLISDFEYFHDRGFEINEKANPLDGHLFFLNGNKWKLLRILLTPVFTSAKLKFMLPEMVRCADLLVDHFKETLQDGDTELKDIFRRFAMDVIGIFIIIIGQSAAFYPYGSIVVLVPQRSQLILTLLTKLARSAQAISAG